MQIYDLIIKYILIQELVHRPHAWVGEETTVLRLPLLYSFVNFTCCSPFDLPTLPVSFNTGMRV